MFIILKRENGYAWRVNVAHLVDYFHSSRTGSRLTYVLTTGSDEYVRVHDTPEEIDKMLNAFNIKFETNYSPQELAEADRKW